MIKTSLTIIAILLSLSVVAQTQQSAAKSLLSSSGADSWLATDALGRKINPDLYPALRPDKFVGIFYFVWQGAHGYDQHRGGAPDGGIMAKTPQDTVSPYDITKLLKANPLAPNYGPVNAFHHWGEPYFGYYLADDEWVIRKHAQMLSDAGVDVIILDATNAAIYLPQVTKIASVYSKLRAAGISTPSIAFIVNSIPKQTVDNLYKEIYSKGLFKDLWFTWKGKPLLLCPPEALDTETAPFFSSRQSWAWSKGQKWFEDGHDKWPWLDHYPQAYGWHESKDKPEQVTGSIAQHPMSNIGRSFHNGKEPLVPSTEKGLYFEEQWKQALEVDPEFVFVTGWNEWVAMRFDDGASRNFLGKKIKKGETYFVDLYNAEFSRDAEPENGQTKDNYYYQLVDNIRKFKGVRKPASADLDMHTISIDGKFADWNVVKGVYQDDEGDTFHRMHSGWGRIKEYVNNSGRNDIIECRVASDQRNVYFYVKTKDKLSDLKDIDWMQLYLGIFGSKKESWQDFQYLINQKVLGTGTTTLSTFIKGSFVKQKGLISYKAVGNEMELRIPLKQLGITNPQHFELQFKWTDNAGLARNDPMQWMVQGDAAPNARFKYRYSRN
ncbi:glycoside hydrolase family 71/99 protein [Pedobacter sp. PWIIR3]